MYSFGEWQYKKNLAYTWKLKLQCIFFKQIFIKASILFIGVT